MKLISAEELTDKLLEIQAEGAQDPDYVQGAITIQTVNRVLKIVEDMPDALKELWRIKLYEGKGTGKSAG